ncbi:MAG TPA: MMPL family transporter [Acidimicrobiales bacterium]|nr:MMPL family transporter [Acidimicrobiales bacterium]
MIPVLSRIAIVCYRHRRRVLLAWVALVVAAVTLGPSLAGRWTNGGRLPGTDSQAAQDVLATRFPDQAGEGDAAVFSGIAGHQAAAQEFLARLGDQPGVTSVGHLQLAPRGDIAYAPFTIANGPNDPNSHPGQTAAAIEHLTRPAGLTVAFSGDSFETGSAPKGDVIGVVAALVVLLVVFGSVIAAGLPIVIALAGIGVAVPLIGMAAHVVPSPNFTDQVAALVGIGVGIDYTLLVVTRYRAALGRHREPEDAVAEALSTAGRSVVLAGSTVVVSLMGLFLMDVSTFDGLAVGTALAVLVVVAAALTLLPALLGFAAGRMFQRFRAAGGPVAKPRRIRFAAGARLSSLVARRPVGLASLGMVALLVLAAPALHLHLGTADAGTDPAGSTTRQAYDLAVQGFGPGAVGPITVVAQAPNTGTHAGATPAAGPGVPTLVTSLERTPGVISVAAPRFSPSGTAADVQVMPAWGPADRRTAALIDRLRHDTLPAVEHQTGLITHVGGETAGDVDFASLTSHRLPFLLIGVLTISFLLLLVGFRSVAIAAQAILLNLLSVGAAYGIMVAVFQWGWGSGLTGAPAAPVAPWIPTMLFAITFGLSMDYEVFVIGAIRDARAGPNDDRRAVTEGLSSTAGVITAAALIMALVFGSFVTSNSLNLKVIGVGLAAAIVVDATIIRLLVVPATMTILGPAAWWSPAWLDRLLSRGRPPRPDRQAATTGAVGALGGHAVGQFPDAGQDPDLVLAFGGQPPGQQQGAGQ